MALTREELTEMGLPKEQVEKIIKGHTDSITGLTEERDRLNRELETARENLRTAQQEAENAKNDLQTARGDAETARNELQAYRKQVEDDKLTAGKHAALRGALKEAGVQREDFVDLLLRAVDLENVELDGDKIKDAAALIDPLKAAYRGCFATTATKGTDPVTPPSGSGQKLTREQVGSMTEAEINANWPEVQAAIGQK